MVSVSRVLLLVKGVYYVLDGDTGATALEDHTSLVNVHATAINEILTTKHLVQADDSLMYGFIIIL